jgi:uncharacterized protein (DUF2252 family)
MTKLLDVRERFALGQERRKQMRRTVHAEWKASQRKEHPLKLLAATMRGRVPALVTLKYERMASSPFGYFRGAVPVMAYDLSLVGNTAILSQLCGDAHVRNLGAYAGPDGRLVFDINDFDETMVGPFEWDVKRMATSLVLAGREAGAKNVHCRDAAAAFLERYRYCIAGFARMPVLEMGRYQVHRLKDVSPVQGILRMAERATPLHTLSALTEVAAGRQSGRVFKTMPPVLTRMKGKEAERVVASLGLYAQSLLRERRHLFSQYKPVDVAFKVVGTGSVGLRDYCVYMQGNGSKDPLFIQIKEEVASAYAPYAGEVSEGNGLSNRRTTYHQGRRVVEGERAMQMQSDPFLGWTTIEGRDYLVRQLNDHKASIQLADLKVGLMEYACVCGELLARGHARSGDCQMLGGYLGKSARFDEAVVKFAEAYADQTEKDWHELVQWMKKPGNKTANKVTLPAHRRHKR